jgi:hypothetical protein
MKYLIIKIYDGLLECENKLLIYESKVYQFDKKITIRKLVILTVKIKTKCICFQ